ncbi:MAG: hypothetical protein EXS35_00645 [Pedosphaera sp.]|nr:hypothetical protein [Pedosphaera sp.]
MARTETQLVEFLSRNIIAGLKELLETKHLYQSVTIPTQDLDEIIRTGVEEHKKEVRLAGPTTNYSNPEEAGQTLSELLHKNVTRLLASHWDFDSETNSYPGARPVSTGYNQGLPPLQMPSVRVSCDNALCKGSAQPHNSGYIGLREGLGVYSVDNNGPALQIFSFPFQCQNCKGEPLIFLVKRDGQKLTLVGRSRITEVSVPHFIPDAQQKFYRNAIIADQTSFTLAAALYLRTVVEQHFYQTVPAAEIQSIRGIPTGDELADLYAKTLPKNFPESFPSLKKAYSDLSAIVHSGKENDQSKKSFTLIRAAVDGHFKAVQLFKEMPTYPS